MQQDVFEKSPNYRGNLTKEVYSADRAMMEMFTLALRERQANCKFVMPKGNGKCLTAL
jgi:hypothetical protein